MLKTINGGQLPTRGSKYSAAVDLYANEDIIIAPGETKLVPLGVCIDERVLLKSDRFLSSHYFQLMLRSSISKHLIIANGIGIVDIDYVYPNEIMIRLHNPHPTG